MMSVRHHHLVLALLLAVSFGLDSVASSSNSSDESPPDILRMIQDAIKSLSGESAYTWVHVHEMRSRLNELLRVVRERDDGVRDAVDLCHQLRATVARLERDMDEKEATIVQLQSNVSTSERRIKALLDEVSTLKQETDNRISGREPGLPTERDESIEKAAYRAMRQQVRLRKAHEQFQIMLKTRLRDLATIALLESTLNDTDGRASAVIANLSAQLSAARQQQDKLKQKVSKADADNRSWTRKLLGTTAVAVALGVLKVKMLASGAGKTPESAGSSLIETAGWATAGVAVGAGVGAAAMHKLTRAKVVPAGAGVPKPNARQDSRDAHWIVSVLPWALFVLVALVGVGVVVALRASEKSRSRQAMSPPDLASAVTAAARRPSDIMY
ncbi:Uncharacterized protein PBTT_05845 [Plasmodiophora brassicae]|uniref:Uncharacterized protein n=1 Tax=Plasmodiophora brassicae TaxID=37360 RepID=A0A0G4J3R9_PLABS|nr:hypothetical protein PBRA_002300 [Plasmodiophora brassicae]SPQ98886.1 unnamed protein product [Plasmodiophora brassicae]